jgi:hypothetical protein
MHECGSIHESILSKVACTVTPVHSVDDSAEAKNYKFRQQA